MSGRHRRGPKWWQTVLVLLLALACGAVIGVSVPLVILSSSSARSSVPVPPSIPVTNPTRTAEVTDVMSPTSLTVRTDAGDVHVRVVGVDDPPSCGLPDALDFAHRELDGQVVVLVGDVSSPTNDPRDGAMLYHVVLRSQMSYSDAAIESGNVVVSSDATWYRDVYLREQAESQDRSDGVWGRPCRLPRNR